MIKPLSGSGGESVFLVKPDGLSNLNQMIDAVSRDGYVIAQEYLPDAVDGDVRLFMMNGQPLRHQGKICAFRRRGSGADHRSNVHQGGGVERAELDARALEVAEIVRPRLVEDGMFLVGLDLVGDKLMEIQRVLAWRPRQRPEDGGRQLRHRRHPVPRAQGPLRELLRKKVQQRRHGHPVSDPNARGRGSERPVPQRGQRDPIPDHTYPQLVAAGPSTRPHQRSVLALRSPCTNNRGSQGGM